MTTKAKSDARRFLESVRGGPLTFGGMISSIRLADGVQQVELARKMKISRAHLCDIEHGRRSVSVDRAAQFARVLGYSANQFVAVAVEDQLRKAGLKVKVRLEAA
ncbi:MAG: helix-turn-helix transcriptional regulator [Terriglobia bacterium]|jgi:transcriptional regulator with XRE-family HTH domain